MISSPQTPTRSWHRLLLFDLANWSLLIAGLANLAVGTWAALHDGATIAVTSLTAGLVLLFAATIDRFESLKGLGVEAKTRQLDQKLSQAEDALQRLRELTEITGAALIDLNSKMGRWDSAPSPKDSIALAERVRQIMLNLGSDQATIQASLRPWAKILCYDIARSELDKLRKELQLRIQALETERREISQSTQPGDTNSERLNAQINEINDFIISKLNKTHQFDLDDYPERFVSLFADVPQLDEATLTSLRRSASRFAPGMTSLKESRTLSDPDLWISALQETRRH